MNREIKFRAWDKKEKIMRNNFFEANRDNIKTIGNIYENKNLIK